MSEQESQTEPHNQKPQTEEELRAEERASIQKGIIDEARAKRPGAQPDYKELDADSLMAHMATEREYLTQLGDAIDQHVEAEGIEGGDNRSRFDQQALQLLKVEQEILARLHSIQVCNRVLDMNAPLGMTADKHSMGLPGRVSHLCDHARAMHRAADRNAARNIDRAAADAAASDAREDDMARALERESCQQWREDNTKLLTASVANGKAQTKAMERYADAAALQADAISNGVRDIITAIANHG